MSASTINLNLDRGPAGQLNVEIDAGDGQFQFTELVHSGSTWRPAPLYLDFENGRIFFYEQEARDLGAL